jgi:hypothetical protein
MSFFANPRVAALIAAPLILLVLSLSLVFTAVDRDTLAETTTSATEATPLAQDAPVADADSMRAQQATNRQAQRPITDEVLWLARVIYSETKRPYEQELVAWVVRNRVETRYRGRSNYRAVVLDPWQFSAFNRNAPKRAHYSNLTRNSRAAGWQTALEIAREVYYAPGEQRPFALTTRHFYSEISMVGRRSPHWARGQRPVALDRPVDPRRFRFFANIS